MMPQIGREAIEQRTSEMNKKSYNRFHWWRRYAPRPELDEKMPLSLRVLNGDFEVSDYYYQAAHELYLLEDEVSTIKDPDVAHERRSLYMERFRRLTDDYEKEEKEIIRKLKRDFGRAFKLTREQVEEEMENFDGTVEELYAYMKEKYKTNKQ
jgi:hypothetical protein